MLLLTTIRLTNCLAGLSGGIVYFHFIFIITMKNYFLIIIISVLFICGCNSKPADVPQLFPCKITITKDGVPVAGVHAVLGLTSGNSSCAVSGITDSSGTAKIRTSRLGWLGNGAPAGEYIVIISKEPKLEAGLSTEEYQKLDPIDQERYQLEQQRQYDALPREIPAETGDVTKSPYRLTVQENGQNIFNIDIVTNK
jgi:hypothetical protein